MTVSPFVDRTDQRSTARSEPRLRAGRTPSRSGRVGGGVAVLVMVSALTACAVRASLAGQPTLSVGLAAVSALTATLVLPSQMQAASRVSGVERVLRSHRWLGSVTVVLVMAYLAAALTSGAATMSRVLSPRVPPEAHVVVTAVAALTLMSALTFARRRLREHGDLWRTLHVVLALVLAAGTSVHVVWWSLVVGDVATRYCLAANALLVTVVLGNRWIRPLLTNRTAFVVDGLRTERRDVRTLVLAPTQRGRGPVFLPGQYAWLRLDRPWGPRVPHPFTISSGTNRPDRLEFAADPRGEATPSLALLRPGRRVYLDGPHDPANTHHQGSLLLVAAHHGIPAMISILRLQAARRDPRPHCLVVGAQAMSDLMFRRELRELAEQLDLDVVEVLSDPAPTWTGRRGRIDGRLLEDVLRQYPSLTSPHAYVCGPPEMIIDVNAALRDLGLSERRIHAAQLSPA